MAGNLSTAISSGMSGQNLAQKKVAGIGYNIANAFNEDYSRQELTFTSQSLGGVGIGVKVEDVVRVTDTFKVEQIRSMTSALSQLDTLNTFYTELNQNLGQPGENNSIASTLNNLKKNIDTLMNRPEIDGSRTAVIRAAQNFSLDLQRLSNLAQSSRQSADTQIYSCVQQVNNLLQTLSGVNNEIQYASCQGQATADLYDMRDANLKRISELMDIRVQFDPQGRATVHTMSGNPLLLTQPVLLTFSQAPGIDPTVAYGQGNGIQGILVGGDATQDITTAISGGKIGGLIKVRDSEMPAFQASLDQLTGVLRDQVNIIHNTGTATSVPQVLTGARSGMAGTDSITGAGTVDIALVDRVTGNLVSKTTIDLSAPGLTLTNIMTQINGLDAVASLDANGVMSIRANNAAQGVAIASSSPAPAYINSGAQNYGFSHYFGLNDFFVTGNVLTGVSPGISSRLAVRPEIVNNMTRLANTNLDITQPIGARVVTSGGNTTLQSLAEIFSAKAIFAAAGKIPALQISLNDYATSIIQYTADEAGFLEQNYDHQTALYDLSLKGLDTLRGVNLQEEIMNLMQWQRQMKVCTQLIMTAQDMLQDLLKMNR